MVGFAALTWFFLALTFLVLHFFRDPQRIIVPDEKTVLSPADGKVIVIDGVHEAPFTGKPALKVSIFMSVFDVHVNRIPISGTVNGIQYRKGRFVPAQKPDASIRNEQNCIWIRGQGDVDLFMTQVAGLIARRIVCWPSVGDQVEQGERFGMIRFGSRMDVYLPTNCEILVTRGQHVYGGETILCRLR